MRRSLILGLAALALAGCGSTALSGAPMGANAPGALARELPTTENFAKVGPELYRGGQPTDEDMRRLYKLGVRTDISLQMNKGAEAAVVAHEREVAMSMNMNFINLPLPFRREPPKAMIDEFLHVFTQARILPAYVHCKHGRDRTGTMVGVFRVSHDKWTGAQALEEMQKFGFKPKDYPEYAKFVLNYKPGQAPQAARRRTGREDEGDLGLFPYVGESDGPTEWPEADS